MIKLPVQLALLYLPSEGDDSVISYVHQKSLCTQICLHFKGEFLKTLHAYNDMVKICISLRHYDLSIFDGIIAFFFHLENFIK